MEPFSWKKYLGYYLQCWKKLADFSGRAMRTEYWTWQFINGAIFLVLFYLSMPIWYNKPFFNGFYSFYMSVSMLTILPGLAVAVRRLHDVGKRGWWILLRCFPVVGDFWLFILALLDSQPGANRFGPNPKEDGAPAGD